MVRHLTRALAGAAALAAAAPMTLAVPAQAATTAATTTSTCRVRWGSLDKGANLTPERTGPILGTPRTGHHTCYDRIVFDVKGTIGSIAAGYYGAPGMPPTLLVAARHDTANPPVSAMPLHATGMRTIVGYGDALWSDKAQAYPVMTRALLPFRVFLLKGPGTMNRVVVDVAHRW